MRSETEVGGAAVVEGFHLTPSGKVSMDPTKWRVAQVIYQDARWDGLTRTFFSTALWGVFPPMASHPVQSCHEHAEAMERAARYAYFKVVPPPQDTEFM